MKKKLLITYDHELYLGKRSGQADDCMLRPAEELMAVMEPFEIRAIFFVDTTYLLRLREMSATVQRCADDYAKITNQLKEMVRRGHYVFPHVHPHWLDATYEPSTNNWDLTNVTKYRFHHISEAERETVFSGSVNLLRDVFRDTDPQYQVNGFRAGGWCIQPFEDFIPYFRKNGIRYEFSVLNGFYQFTDAQYFDFSSAPSKNIYPFSSDVCREDPSGPYTQFSIDAVQIAPATQFLNKLWVKYLYRVKGDHTFNRGSGQPSHAVSGAVPSSSKGIELGHPGIERISVEMLTAVKLPAYLRHLSARPYMHFLSHPKMITRHSLNTFSSFLRKSFASFDLETDFMKMTEPAPTQS